MPRNVVVIAIDRLGAGWLGPYGNTWVETPTLNQLAAESVLCEFLVSDSHDLEAIYRSLLTGQPAWHTTTADPSATLPQLANAAGYQTLLVTDAAAVAHHPSAAAFEQIDLLAWQRAARSAKNSDKTRSAEVFSAAIEALAASSRPRLLWIHAAAMNAAWDAPLALREQVTAEGDPAPLELVEPPACELAKGYDPDQLLGMVQAYAAEVMSLDTALATLLKGIDAACDPAETLLILTSPRGYPLGEHRRVGLTGDALRGEVLQVPLLIRYPGCAGRLTRLSGLQQPSDLFAILSGAIQSEDLFPLEKQARECVIASAGDELALRTRHWFYRESSDSEVQRSELYTKPDDRWEVNEISQRAADVCEAFGELANWIRDNRNLPSRPSLPTLPEIVTQARR